MKYIRKFVLNFTLLFTAVSFFRLRGRDMIYYQIIYPTLLCFFILISYFILSKYLFVFDLSSLMGSSISLMGVLIGFYIAALAAVTSFPNSSLDNKLSGDQVTINNEALTRRRYIAVLLGYCAFISIFLYIFGSFSSSVKMVEGVNEKISEALSFLWWSIYSWISLSLFVVTMLCLHYLVYRMHRE